MLTGTFRLATTEETIARREALQKCRELESQIAMLRNAAFKEKQVARRVELNLEIKGLVKDFLNWKNAL